MATFGKLDSELHPSAVGEKFPVDSRVMFTVYGKPQTGTVTKQLRNSALVELDETSENSELRNQRNGILVINYKKMKKIN